MANATKTKRTKISECVPPVEVRENTKARREWLAAKLAHVNSFVTETGARWEGKIVGKGSYQVVSVYEVTEVEGRLRQRGHCQFCGNAQVVDNGAMVLHGYSRPGIGYVFNECPCVGRAPLEVSQTLTETYLQDAIALKASLEKKLAKAEIEERDAMHSLYGGNESAESGAYQAKPHFPKTGYVDRKPTAEQLATYDAAMKEWAVNFPKTARYVAAQTRKNDLSNNVWRAKQQVEHFETLLGWKLLGKPLIDEVVA